MERVRNEEVIHSVKEDRNILHSVKRWNTNWVGQIFNRNCLLKQFIEGKIEGGIEVMGRQ
jgi:hypothetical protein